MEKGRYLLQSNRELHEKGLKLQLSRRLIQNNVRLMMGVTKEQIQSGIVEPSPEKATGYKIHYIPHHEIVKIDAQTMKLSLVYDASSKRRNVEERRSH